MRKTVAALTVCAATAVAACNDRDTGAAGDRAEETEIAEDVARADAEDDAPDDLVRPSTTSDAGTADSAPTTTDATAATSGPSMTPDSFVAAAATANLAEIRVSELAATRATNQKVKDFAAKMVQDHRAALERLRTAAGSRAVPAAPDAAAMGELSMLEDASGDFDQEFLEYQVRAHERAAELFRGYAAAGSDAALTTYAAETLPKVEAHLVEVRQIRQSYSSGGAGGATNMNASPTTGGVATPPTTQPGDDLPDPADDNPVDQDPALDPNPDPTVTPNAAPDGGTQAPDPLDDPTR